jgi:HEPN domain-containing protein
MKIDAETYRQAALEHIDCARDLYEGHHYLLSHYAAGLAVECLIRAFWCRLDPNFPRHQHDLDVQRKASGFDAQIPEGQFDKISAAIGDVRTRWSSVHRYGSDAALRSHLKRAKLDLGIRGDFLKENSRRIVNAALEIVTLGVRRWNLNT